MYRDIKDYAIIGNLKSAALVSKYGSIDWAPAPFIDSPSVFAAILDHEQGGFWSVSPTGEYSSEQEYIPKTNIVKTVFTTQEGEAELIDFIPVEKDKDTLLPEDKAVFEIYRKVRCTKGTCSISVTFLPKYNYAQGETTIEEKEKGLLIYNETNRATLVSSCAYTVNEKGHARTTLSLQEGEEHVMIFRYNTADTPESYELSYELEYNYTKNFWEEWLASCDLGRCNFTSFWEKQVERSALLLKILFFEPTGAIAAAPTTSLPEAIGGVRNWDYRFTWIRDSAFTLLSLLEIGHSREAQKYIEWLFDMCSKGETPLRTHPEQLQIMYGLRGQTKLEEEILTHFEGYKNSKPVRIGNGAYLQKQWDIYGSILDTLWQMAKRMDDLSLVKRKQEDICALVNYAQTIWKEPDEGLWEVRGGKKHFTYSKVMCWVALDRGVKLAEKFNLEADTSSWKKEIETIKKEVLEKGWNEEKGAFTQSYESDALDSALLRMSQVGFIEGDDPKMIATINKIEEELSFGDGLLYRYKTEDGLPGEEGAFFLASFWFIDALVLAGEEARAAALFEKVLSHKNHVGLFSEEIDIKTEEFLGNFPQAYTHIGLINTAFNLSRAT